MKQAPKWFIHWFSVFVLKVFKWNAVAAIPLPPRCIIIGAPHTSNFDLILGLLLMGAQQVRFNWVGKKEAFWWPLGLLFRKLGGIPLDRKKSKKFVDQIIQLFNEREMLRVAIAPEGTRRKTSHWRTGFYYMAHGAGVPIVMAFIDKKTRVVGWSTLIHTTGDIQADFEIIRRFYLDKHGINPNKKGEITIKLV